MRLVRLAVLVCAGLVCAETPAAAQIYSWRDQKGVLHLSTTKVDPTAKLVASASNAASHAIVGPRAYPSRFDHLITHHATRHGISADLVRAVIKVESAFNPLARSPKGAQGLMQLMPATAARFGVRNPFDPAENIRAGVSYLRGLLDQYRGNYTLALAAYNAGPEAVKRYGGKVPPYRETRDYVAKIGAATGVTQKRHTTVYKTMVTIGGREVPRYSTTKPTTGPYSIVSGR